jgi:uridylate kinase
MSKPAYRRVLVKVSGEALMGGENIGFDPKMLARFAADLADARSTGTEIAVMVGGGNFLRGAAIAGSGIDRATADQMGMLATVINALALGDAIEKAGAASRVMSAVPMHTICEPYARQRGLKHLGEGRILVLGGGTGNPFFTTDTSAALRAAELQCEAILKATDVDGVYDADPKKDPKAKRFDRLSHDEALSKNLKVMDAAAFALARDARLPIIVFSIREKNAIASAVRGQGRLTTVVP